MKISPEAMVRLERYSWPGNVRELENVIERAVALETTPMVLADRLPDSLASANGHPAPVFHEGFRLDDYLLSLERELVRNALRQAGGDRGGACQLLGINSRSLRYLIAKHRVDEGRVKN